MVDIESIKKWFAAETRDRMAEMGLRPYHLIGLCKMKESNVESYLNGRILPNLFNLILLAEHLECTVNDLLGYDEVEEIEYYEQYSASSMYFTESQYAVCLSYRMRKYMEEHFITIKDLADKMNICDSSVRHWFANKHPHLPPTIKFLQICEVLNCTPSELLGY